MFFNHEPGPNGAAITHYNPNGSIAGRSKTGPGAKEVKRKETKPKRR